MSQQRQPVASTTGEGSSSTQPNCIPADSNISAQGESSRGKTRCPPGRKTKGQKCREHEAAEEEAEGFISSDDPSNYYAQPKLVAVEHFAALPSIIMTAAPRDPADPVVISGAHPSDAMDTDVAIAGGAIPIPQTPLRDDPSLSQPSLLPHTMQDDASSNASSRPPKRSHETSPTRQTTGWLDTGPQDKKI